MVQYTVDDAQLPALFARRTWRPEAPNDAAARRSLVRGLREQAAADPELAGTGLTIEGAETPVAGGVDFRLEQLGGIQTLVATFPGAAPLRVQRPWSPTRRAPRAWILGLGAAALSALLWGFGRKAGARKARDQAA